MRSKAAAIALAVAFSTTLTATAFVVPQEASAQSRRGYDMFYDDLAQDGRWVDHPRYGWVWYPTRVRADWRPYSDGRWVWTDRYGWYWESNERFGWATYHYGRWGYDDEYGHIWVPGDEWAPAWVSFRDSDEAIGWAPLPPETLGMTLIALLAGGSSGSYYRYVDMSDSYYQPRWTFVPTRYFTQPRVYSHAYSWRDNDRYYRSSRNVTNYITVNNYYVNRSIDPRRLESRIGRKIEPVYVRDANSRDQWRNRDRNDQRNIAVYNPRIERSDRNERGAPPEAVRAKATDKPAVQVRPEFAAPEERRANLRDRDNRNDRDGRDRDGRPGMTGQNPGTPDVKTVPPTDRAGQPGRDRNDLDRNDGRAQQQKVEQDRLQQQKAAQEKAAQERAQQQKAQQDKAAQDRAAQQKAQQDKAAQDRAAQQERIQQRAQQQKAAQDKAAQDRAQQQKMQQERIQQQKAQQQQRIQQQQQRDNDRAAPARTQAPDRAKAPERQQQRPQQATRPEPRQEQQRQAPQKQQQQQQGGNDCPPGQKCR